MYEHVCGWVCLCLHTVVAEAQMHVRGIAVRCIYIVRRFMKVSDLFVSHSGIGKFANIE